MPTRAICAKHKSCRFSLNVVVAFPFLEILAMALSKLKAKKMSPAAMLVCEEVFSMPELRDAMLEWAIFKPPKQNPSGSTSIRHKLKVWARILTVCKDWQAAVRGTPDMIKKLLSQHATVGTTQVCPRLLTPAYLFPVPLPLFPHLSAPAHRAPACAHRRTQLSKALAISSAKLKEFHPPEAYTDGDDSDNEEEGRVPKYRYTIVNPVLPSMEPPL